MLAHLSVAFTLTCTQPEKVQSRVSQAAVRAGFYCTRLIYSWDVIRIKLTSWQYRKRAGLWLSRIRSDAHVRTQCGFDVDFISKSLFQCTYGVHICERSSASGIRVLLSCEPSDGSKVYLQPIKTTDSQGVPVPALRDWNLCFKYIFTMISVCTHTVSKCYQIWVNMFDGAFTWCQPVRRNNMGSFLIISTLKSPSV